MSNPSPDPPHAHQAFALSQLSASIAATAAGATPSVVLVIGPHGAALAGIHWRDTLIVTSEQGLPEAEHYAVARVSGGAAGTARLVGRDPTTNVALLRLDVPSNASLPELAPAPLPGSLALALGGSAGDGVVVRLASLTAVGPAWTSLGGGRIDQRLLLDIRASRAVEGGPVIDAQGRLLGMATAGPRERTLVIPHQTIDRAIEPLLAHGQISRGWLGVGLQPVAVPEALRAEAGQKSGLMVISLTENGPAETIGVLPGDILLTLGDASLAQGRGIGSVLGPHSVGQALPLRLLRAGAVVTLTPIITARQAA